MIVEGNLMESDEEMRKVVPKINWFGCLKLCDERHEIRVKIMRRHTTQHWGKWFFCEKIGYENDPEIEVCFII